MENLENKLSTLSIGDTADKDKIDNIDKIDTVCPICLDPTKTTIHIICNHIFCYLCLKETVKYGNYKCPICRADIPQDFAENAFECIDNAKDEIRKSVWSYSGRNNGWWFYQEDHNLIIEEAWKLYKESNGPETVIVSICSVNYTVDLKNMLQISFNNNSVRKIKRMENVTLKDSKGIAGLKYVTKDQLPKNLGITHNNYINSTNPNHFNSAYINTYLDSSEESESTD
jgi:hypothetical protein